MSVINEEGVTTRTSMTRASTARTPESNGTVVYLDMDAVLLDAHQGERAIEINVQGNVEDGLHRLGQIADEIVVLAFPDHTASRGRPSVDSRVKTFLSGLSDSESDISIVTCPHGRDPYTGEPTCSCAKPGTGLIDVSREGLGRSRRGWFVGADQNGIHCGRSAGLQTIRIGPLGTDHMSTVHRPDYEARDLLDAANHILIEDLN